MAAVNLTDAVGVNNETTINNTNIHGWLFIKDAGGMLTFEDYKISLAVIYQILIPIVAVFGIIGNTASLLVFYKDQSRTAFTVYLKALTASDLLMLVFALLRSLVTIVHEHVISSSFAMAVCNLYINISIGGCLQRLSATFITIIALERFFAALFPWFYKRSVLHRRPRTVIATMIGIHAFLTIPTWILLRIAHVPTSVNDAAYAVLPVWTTEIADRIQRSHMIVIVGIGTIAPLIIVLITTISIVVQFQRIRNIKSSLEEDVADTIEYGKMILVVLGIAAMLIVCMSLSTTIYILSFLRGAFYYREHVFIMVMADVTIVLLCVSAATDFVVYVMASRKFRLLFMQQLSKICCRSSHVDVGESQASPLSGRSTNRTPVISKY